MVVCMCFRNGNSVGSIPSLAYFYWVIFLCTYDVRTFLFLFFQNTDMFFFRILDMFFRCMDMFFQKHRYLFFSEMDMFFQEPRYVFFFKNGVCLLCFSLLLIQPGSVINGYICLLSNQVFSNMILCCKMYHLCTVSTLWDAIYGYNLACDPIFAIKGHI